jgi:hypothetical protein
MTEDEVYQGLIDRGIPATAAQGIVMNLRDESGLDPGINEQNPTVPGSRGGFGLAQWTGPRRNALEGYAASVGRPVSDAETQLDFLVSELQGPEKKAFKLTLGAGTPGAAASIFAKEFLRPAKANLDRRVAQYSGENALGGYAQQQPPDMNALMALLQQQQKPQMPQLQTGLDPAMFKHRWG